MLNRGFLQKVSKYISDNSLLERKGKYIVALSGGADSVALLLTLVDLGYDVEAAHCNFHLRGLESDRDELFCSKLCNDNGLQLHLVHFDTLNFAKLRKISIEMAARHLRYSWFQRLKKDIGASAICVAHHKDDSVETVLMNLIRGTGIHGLAGIKSKNGDVVRPLLCVSRNEIEQTLRYAGQDFVTDSTNFVDDVVRNKIRLDILPLMKKINPSVSEGIIRTAARVSEIAAAFDSFVKKEKSSLVEIKNDGVIWVALDEIRNKLAPENILFNLLRDYSFNSSQIEQIYRLMSTGGVGRLFYSPTHRLLIDRKHIVIEPFNCDCQKCMVIPEDGIYIYTEIVKFKVETIDCTKDFSLVKNKDCCYVDLSKISMPLTVRPVMTGDRFVPFGMRGSKLLSDYLTDLKINLFDRQRQLVMTDATGQIVWVVGRRGDNRCRITKTTGRFLKITCIMALKDEFD